MKERISKLDKNIQEYINIGVRIGLFDDSNLERVISRLERVRFSIDNNNPGDAQTAVIRDPNNSRVSRGLDVRINEEKLRRNDKEYFRDEVIFHELTHCVNGIYENWMENLSLYFDFDKIFKKQFPGNDERIDELSKLPQFRQKGYAWLVLDEFVAQFISQLFVQVKRSNRLDAKRIYPKEQKEIKQSNPRISVFTDIVDYYEFSEIVEKFVNIVYGENGMKKFIKDSIGVNSINKIFDVFKNKEYGFDYLYSLLGEMGNIGFAVASRNFTEAQRNTDKDMTARDPHNFYSNYQKFLSIIDSVEQNKAVVAGVEGNFGPK